MLAALETTLTRVPQFAFAIAEGTSMRLAVRGGLQIRTGATIDSATVAVSGEGVAMLAERVIDNPGAVVIEPIEGATAGGSLPLESGVVYCGTLYTALAADVSAVVETPSMTTLPPPVDPGGAASGPVSETTNDPFALSDFLTDDEPETPAPTPEPTPEASPSAPPESPAPQASPPLAPIPAEPTPPVPIETPTKDGMIAGVPDFGADDGNAVVSVTRDTPAAAPDPSPIPAVATAPESAAPAPEASELPPGDHDGSTITADELREIRDSQPVSAVTSSPQKIRQIAVFSTGQRQELDRPVVVGRLPRAKRVTGDLPHLVAVPSPESSISSTHLELRAEGSAVVAVDLDSTNGTFLRRVGSEPIRLRANDPTVLISGDVLDLGENVTVTYVEES